MSKMNSNPHAPTSSHAIPNAPKAPPLPVKPGAKPPGAKPGGVAAPVNRPPVGPKAPPPKPGFDQSSYSNVTKNAKPPTK